MIWSFSNSLLFRKCQRQWYFKTHVANANAKKIPLQREAYILSKLQTVAAWRGSVVDHVISRRVVPALNHGWNISLANILAYAKSVFDAQLRFARQHRLRESDMSVAKAGDDFAAFYAVEYGTDVSDEELAQAWNDVRRALTNLVEMRSLLALLGTSSKLVAQRALTFPYFGVTVRAVPDLIAFFGDAAPLIVDWKVHTFGVQDYRLQLATYAVALARCEPHKDFPLPASPYAPADVRLLEVQLLTNQQREYTLSELDVEEIDSYIADTATVMLLADGENGKGPPRPFDYPVTQFPETCRRCPFRAPCWEDQSWQASKQISFR
ncbi:MAG TPA: PD-(D/E)XK nuclease family protein [Pyrinomonadaceae bacterium]|jgi:hypothetical protein